MMIHVCTMMNVVFVMEMVYQMENVIVLEIHWMQLEFVVETAMKTIMATAFVTIV